MTDILTELRVLECRKEALRREHNRRAAADVLAWRKWEREEFRPRSRAIEAALIDWRQRRAFPVVLDAMGMPLPDEEADAVRAAVRALPDDSPELTNGT